MRLFLKWGSLIIVAIVLAGYLGDAAVLQIRLHHGTAYRVIQVDQFLTTPLKGQKEEYDFTGELPVQCVRTLFPHLGLPPCWWVERHRSQWN